MGNKMNRTAAVNEYSTRYSEAIDLMETTNPSDWRLQSKSSRQGSDADFLSEELGKSLSQGERNIHEMCRAEYKKRLSLGVAREQARKDLPLSNMTEAYWKIDLHNLLHNFLAKRLKPEAQLEIRRYAQVIADIVKKWVPHTWEAFEDYVLNAMTLSKSELEIISYRKLGAVPLSPSEVRELTEKCVKLGVVLEP
jgi:thymidylate synthase (FAD)